MTLRNLIMTAGAAALLSVGCARATELNVTIYWSPLVGGPTTETFGLDTSAGEADTVADYVYFPITNDSTGATGIFFGDANVSGRFGTGPSVGPQVTPTNYSDYFYGTQSSPPLYSGTGVSLSLNPGQTYYGYYYSNLTTSVAGPVAVPEPAAWVLMLAGFGGLGVALRSRRRPATAGV